MVNFNTVYLLPGEVYFSNKDEFVYTILGSCVSVIFYDKKNKISAISHSLLPTCRNENLKPSDENKFKYVDYSINHMFETFEKNRYSEEDLEIKLFGGSALNIKTAKEENGVGYQNIVMAKQMIKDRGFKINKHDTGGSISRKIIFAAFSGDVFLKRLQ